LVFPLDKKTDPPILPLLNLLAWTSVNSAPAFALSDQFGHTQSIETLKGSNGTILPLDIKRCSEGYSA
jgi:hypothetical protein